MDKLSEKQFHTVWTQAVRIKGYDKRHFQNLLTELKNNGLIDNNFQKTIGLTRIERGIFLEASPSMGSRLEDKYRPSLRRLHGYLDCICIYQQHTGGGSVHSDCTKFEL